jgi:hypothetical protein
MHLARVVKCCGVLHPSVPPVSQNGVLAGAHLWLRYGRFRYHKSSLLTLVPSTVSYRPRLCENSDSSIVRENPTAQNGPQSTIGTSGDILQLPKTRAVGVFTQPGPKADLDQECPSSPETNLTCRRQGPVCRATRSRGVTEPSRYSQIKGLTETRIRHRRRSASYTTARGIVFFVLSRAVMLSRGTGLLIR